MSLIDSPVAQPVSRPVAQQEIVVSTPQQLQNIDSSKVYKIDGVIDFTGSGLNIVVPAGGFTYRGLGSNVSQIKCDDDNHTLFTSPAGGSGDLFGGGCSISVTGAGSQVYDLFSADGEGVIALDGVNYSAGRSLGRMTDYRQLLETDTGRFARSPELVLDGNWSGGARISVSNAFGFDEDTVLFRAGPDLRFGGRFITDMLVDLPTGGALFDFTEANFANDESLIINNAYVSRNGVFDPSDTTIYPNIDHTSTKSKWVGNTGLPNTQKYLKAVCDAELETSIDSVDTYYPLLGTMTIDKAVHLSMPVNGQYELLTGDGVYNIVGTIQIKGNDGDLIDLSVTKSSDGFATDRVEINHIRQEIPNLAGNNDFATFSVNFIERLKKGDRLRLEVENKSAARNVTMGAQSFIIVIAT